MMRWLVFASQFACIMGLTKSEVTNTIVPKLRNIIKGPLVGTVVRLSFHDCAGLNGCDGCLGYQLPENAGLKGAIDTLGVQYQSLTMNPKPSLADFWALAGIVAVNVALENVGAAVPLLLQPSSFRWGRIDCKTAPLSNSDTGADFPSAFFGTTDVLNYFSLKFKFSAQQTVAIMGAHNLGQARLANSGFLGAWKGGPTDRLDNGYYLNLQSNPWVQYAYSTNHFQWVRPTPPPPPGQPAPVPQSTPMLLDADVAVFKTIPTTANGRVTTCQFNNCQPASSATFVNDYATKLGKFHTDFTNVFLAMLQVCGRPSLGTITPCQTTTVV